MTGMTFKGSLAELKTNTKPLQSKCARGANSRLHSREESCRTMGQPADTASFVYYRVISLRKKKKASYTLNSEINVVCCVGRVEIQIETDIQRLVYCRYG